MLYNYNSFNEKQKIYEQLLLEGRIDDLKKRYDGKIDKEIIEYFEKEDPTDNKAYLEWLLKTYNKLDSVEKERLERLKVPVHETMVKLVTKFHNIKSNLDAEDKNINNNRTVYQLYQVLQQVMKDYSEIEGAGSVDVYVNNEEWVIFTPYEYEVAEEFGHVDPRQGRSWCVCYDEKYFKEYFCPDGGIRMIINKFDETKNLALQIEKYGDITVWDYKDESVLDFSVRIQEPFIKYLKEEGGYEFVIDFFEKEPLTNMDTPDIDMDDLKDRWVSDNEWYWTDYIDSWNWHDHFDWNGVTGRIASIVSDDPGNYISYDAMFDYITELDLEEDELSDYDVETYDDLEQGQYLRVIEDYGNIADLASDYADKLEQHEIEDIIENQGGVEDFDDYLDIPSFLREVAENIDNDLLIPYY